MRIKEIAVSAIKATASPAEPGSCDRVAYGWVGEEMSSKKNYDDNFPSIPPMDCARMKNKGVPEMILFSRRKARVMAGFMCAP